MSFHGTFKYRTTDTTFIVHIRNKRRVHVFNCFSILLWVVGNKKTKTKQLSTCHVIVSLSLS